jgi:hypothetical protein
LADAGVNLQEESAAAEFAGAAGKSTTRKVFEDLT